MLKKHLLRLIAISSFLFLSMQLLADEELHYNQVYFQVQNQQDVSNDRMEAVLRVNEEHADPAELAGKINQTMAWALDVGAAYATLKTMTRAYHTRPIYHSKIIQGWRGSQELLVKGDDFAAIAELMGKLQSRLQVTSVNFYVSNESRDRIESELIQNALRAYKSRARSIADELGFSMYRIVDLHVSTNAQLPRSQQVGFARALAAEAVVDPSFEAGESTLTVTVAAKVELR